jgi:hypothetical protein
MRSTTLLNVGASAIEREIGSKYDVVKAVSEYLAEIEQLAAEDIGALIASLNEAKDFTGITVVGGVTAGWDAVNKILTVPTVKVIPVNRDYKVNKEFKVSRVNEG